MNCSPSTQTNARAGHLSTMQFKCYEFSMSDATRRSPSFTTQPVRRFWLRFQSIGIGTTTYLGPQSLRPMVQSLHLAHTTGTREVISSNVISVTCTEIRSNACRTPRFSIPLAEWGAPLLPGVINGMCPRPRLWAQLQILPLHSRTSLAPPR